MKMRKWITWRQLFPWCLLVCLTLLTFVGLSHNAGMYHEPLAVVQKVVHDERESTTDQFENHAIQHTQHIAVRLLNGEHKGRVVHITNVADSAQAVSQILKPGQQIFLQRGDDGIWQFATMKRDQIWIPLMVFVLGTLVLLMGRAGRLTVVSLAINILLFIVTIYIDLQLPDGNIFWLFAAFSLIASIITLSLVLNVRTKLMWAVTLTVVTTTMLAILIAYVVFAATNDNGLHLELMEYITQVPKPLFFSMALVGILGAVMDEATDMLATLFAMIDERPSISTRELIAAGRHVGQEIFGALTNVLFLIFIAEQIPIAILYLRNGNTWSFTYSQNLSLGMIQTLISAIGIVMTVPVGIMWALILRRIKRAKEVTV